MVSEYSFIQFELQTLKYLNHDRSLKHIPRLTNKILIQLKFYCGPDIHEYWRLNKLLKFLLEYNPHDVLFEITKLIDNSNDIEVRTFIFNIEKNKSFSMNLE